MTEFAKTSQRLNEIRSTLQNISACGYWGGHKTEIDGLGDELNGSLASRMEKFKVRVSERTYGSAMELKVKNCLEEYSDILQKFALVVEEVNKNYMAFITEQSNYEKEQQQRLQQEEIERRHQELEEERKKQEAEQLRTLQLQEAALQEAIDQQGILIRRHERERGTYVQGELEERQSMKNLEKNEREKIEEDIALRRKKEQARDEKRRRVEAILQQHRQAKEKGEQQLIAEAIAMSLQEGPSAKAPSAEADQNSPSSSTETSCMDVDSEDCSENMAEKAELPPAADIETEEMLIKQAIELSLQLSAATPLSHQGNSRADKTPDASSP